MIQYLVQSCIARMLEMRKISGDCLHGIQEQQEINKNLYFNDKQICAPRAYIHVYVL